MDYTIPDIRPSIVHIPFSRAAVADWIPENKAWSKWAIVYVLTSANDVYIGETHNVVKRMRKHISDPAKQHLRDIRMILHPMFNKSVCLDLEAYLIEMAFGDGRYRVLNDNAGQVGPSYYQKAFYGGGFADIFNDLRRDGIFSQSVAAIENSYMFKLSPFKALTENQEDSVAQIVTSLLEDLRNGHASSTVIQGNPGTGKTIVAVYLLKLLADIGAYTSANDRDSDSAFYEFFTPENRDLLKSLRLGLVVPQQSLRASLKKVFGKTPGLSPSLVLSPFDVGQDRQQFNLLVVDETHRLSQRACQPSGIQNKQFRDITTDLFNNDDLSKTQLDWIRSRSQHQIYLLDVEQSVKPADLPYETLSVLVGEALAAKRHFTLGTQMRIQAGADFVSYIRRVLSPDGRLASHQPQKFDGYDFRLFDSFAALRDEILARNREVGHARILAGYAWPWRSKKDKNAFDIDIDGVQLCWNSTQRDWIASSKSLDEAGCVHVVQGYDLNYAGVIIGRDLRFDASRQRLEVDRASYFDKSGKLNNKMLKIQYGDADLVRFVAQIYGVLLTRGIRGTYVYACDEALREYLRRYIPTA